MPTFEYGKSIKLLIVLTIGFFVLPILMLTHVIPKMVFILCGMAVLILGAYAAWTLIRTAIFHLLYTLKNLRSKPTANAEDTKSQPEAIQSDKKSWATYDDEIYEEETHS